MRPHAVVLAVVLAAVLALCWSAAAEARDLFAPRAWSDAAEFPGEPLDLREVSFGQRETELRLTVRMYGRLSDGLAPDNGVCLELIGDGAVCLRAGRNGRVVVGRRVAGALRAIPGATVRELSRRSVSVRFHPRAARLHRGTARWSVASRWQAHGRCADGCEDRAPARGHRTAKIGVLGQPRCYGAAARAGRRPCRNPALGRTVTPRPFDALLMSDLPCRPRKTPLRRDQSMRFRLPRRAACACGGPDRRQSLRAPAGNGRCRRPSPRVARGVHHEPGVRLFHRSRPDPARSHVCRRHSQRRCGGCAIIRASTSSSPRTWPGAPPSARPGSTRCGGASPRA